MDGSNKSSEIVCSRLGEFVDEFSDVRMLICGVCNEPFATRGHLKASRARTGGATRLDDLTIFIAAPVLALEEGFANGQHVWTRGRSAARVVGIPRR